MMATTEIISFLKEFYLYFAAVSALYFIYNLFFLQTNQKTINKVKNNETDLKQRQQKIEREITVLKDEKALLLQSVEELRSQLTLLRAQTTETSAELKQQEEKNQIAEKMKKKEEEEDLELSEFSPTLFSSPPILSYYKELMILSNTGESYGVGRSRIPLPSDLATSWMVEVVKGLVVGMIGVTGESPFHGVDPNTSIRDPTCCHWNMNMGSGTNIF
jgi:hypothetical protein